MASAGIGRGGFSMHQQVPTPVGLQGNAAPQRMHLASKGAFSLVSARTRLNAGVPPMLGGFGVRDGPDERLSLVYVSCIRRVELQRTGRGTSTRRIVISGRD